jgi:hypothetical protein
MVAIHLPTTDTDKSEQRPARANIPLPSLVGMDQRFLA